MGLLALGTPLHWNESKNLAEHVRGHGIVQLLNSYNAAKDRREDEFLWGDEIEYMMVYLKSGESKLALEEDDVLARLGEEGTKYQSTLDNDVLFHPEYGRFMLEATPLRPYNGELKSLLYVEKNMRKRRDLATKEIVDPNVFPLTLTTFPLMGCEGFCYPNARVHGSSSKSLFLPDEIINKHVRFPTLTANIRRRRGQKVAINIPLFRDENTRSETDVDPSIPVRSLFPYSDMEAHSNAAKPNHIYMDAMGFGMGSSCLQVTMQLSDIFEARYIYDSMINITPLLLAVTAAAPVFRGQLADQDVRWNVIAGAVDDRTPFERDVEPIKDHSLYGGHFDNVNVQQSMKKIPKSRYDSVDQYLGDLNAAGEFGFFDAKYNDIAPPINEQVKSKLIDAGFDEPLASHFGHLFIRDPLVVFGEDVDQDDTTGMDHFENIQSTNWQSLRFKIPSQNSGPGSNKPGWRVEVRTMEIQLSDFENAAYSIFTILLSRAFIKDHWNWYLPISKVETNMKRGHSRDAIHREKFWFKVPKTNQVLELSLDEIFNGSVKVDWEGLIPIVERYIIDSWGKIDERLRAYLDLVKGRASGELPTAAKCIREIVHSHPNYKKNSFISSEVGFSICEFARNVGESRPNALKSFLGDNLASHVLEI